MNKCDRLVFEMATAVGALRAADRVFKRLSVNDSVTFRLISDNIQASPLHKFNSNVTFYPVSTYCIF